MIGIYKFTSPTGAVYVGQAKNIEARYNQHKWGKRWINWRFAESVEKHGFEAHVFEVLQECIISELDDLERYYQDLYDVCGDNGLNCKLTMTKDKPLYLRPETLKQMSEVKTGKKFTEEHKAKIGASKIGKKRDPELFKRIVANRKPPVRTEAGLASFREKMRGHTFNVGKVRTPEMKEMWSKAGKEYYKNTTKEHPTAKVVVDMSTGIFFDNAREAAKAYNIKNSTLYAMFSGRLKLTYDLKYADETTPEHQTKNRSVRKIKALCVKSGDILGRYDSLKQCAEHLSISPKSIRNILKGSSYGIKGFTFSYA